MQRSEGGRAPVAVRAQRRGEGPVQPRGDGARPRHVDSGSARQPLLERLARGSAAPVRTVAQQRFVERHREAELVGARVERLAPMLLQRHVTGRPGPQRLAGRRRSAAPRGDGQPEVRHPEPPVAPDEQILGLHVPVHQPRIVDCLQPARGLEEHPADLGRRPRRAVEPAQERLALHVLQGEVDLVLPGADVVHRQDVRMGHPGERLGLGHQALAPGLRVLPRGAEQLQGDAPVEGEVVGPVDDPHPPAAQAVQDDVPAQGRPARQPRDRPPDPVVRRGARRASARGRWTTHLSW